MTRNRCFVSVVHGTVSHLSNGLIFAGAVLDAFQYQDSTLHFVSPAHQYQLFYLR